MRFARGVLLGLVWVGGSLVIAGCGGGATKHSSTRPAATGSFQARRQRSLLEAGCSTAVARGPRLSAARTALLHVSGPPFGIAARRDGRFSFVDELGGHVAVFPDAGSTPRAVRTIDVPQDALGNSLTRDGRYLLVANGGDGATVVSVARAEARCTAPVLGTLTQPGRGGRGGGAIEVTSSPDGRYAFVLIEYGDVVAVYDLKAALAEGFRASSYLGSVPLGRAVVGMAVSGDGRCCMPRANSPRVRRLPGSGRAR
jgi:DNA-binding beta-propeller fold protein YncE